MELSKLQTIVIIFVFVSMILGVGVLVLDSFSRATRVSTSITDANVNVSSGAATLAQTYCEDVTAIRNAANATTYDVGSLTFVNTDTCRVTSTLPVKGLYNVTYTYGVADDATTATDNTVTAVQGIGSTWMPLIVTVAILAIILTIVIGSFANKR